MHATMKEPGRRSEKMSDVGFRAMAWMFRVRDAVRPPGRVIGEIGIREGMTVVDYGCGPGSNIRAAADLVGPAGRVIGVDIHELAVTMVMDRAEREGLANVSATLARGYDSGLGDATADLVYALDMFHMIQDPQAFLAELHRITRPGGVLVIDDGHQPRAVTIEKIRRAGCWTIEEETDAFLRCRRTDDPTCR